MNITYDNIDTILAKLYAQSITDQELAVLDQWRAINDDNEIYFQEMYLTRKILDKAINAQKIDTDSAWHKVEEHVLATQNNVRPLFKNSKPDFSLIWKIAVAACLVGVLTFYVIGLQNNITNRIHYATTNAKKMYLLKNGSKIELMPNSSMTQLDTKSRKYTVKGEVKIDVAHSGDAPLEIHAYDALIQDIGTKFSIKNYEDNDSISVHVEEGIVRFYTLESAGLYLYEGDHGVYIKSEKRFYKYNNAQSKTISYNFKNAPLSSIAKQIEDTFHKKVIFTNEKLKSCLLTVNFDEAPLNTALDIIVKTMGIEANIAESEIEISGNECN
jgi:transmembrane sensor